MASEQYNLYDGVSYKDGKFYRNNQEYNPDSYGFGKRQILNQQLERARRDATQKQGLALADEQQNLANEFQQNLPKYTGLLKDQSAKTIQSDLAEKITGLKQQSSSRGFLKGSGTQRQQAEAIAGSQSEQMAKGMDIEDMLSKQSQTLKNQALATKLSMQSGANQAYIDQLRQNILDTQRQGELYRALGAAVGPAAGYYMANKGT